MNVNLRKQIYFSGRLDMVFIFTWRWQLEDTFIQDYLQSIYSCIEQDECWLVEYLRVQ